MHSDETELFTDRTTALAALGPDECGAVEHVEELWPRFRPFADHRFLDEFRAAVGALESATESTARDRAFRGMQQRYWEMYLACGLLDRGIRVVPFDERPSSGPDILVELESTRLWIECIVPEPGQSADAVIEPSEGRATSVPDEGIGLRLLSAVREKRKRFREYVDDGIVHPTDAQVIAINGRCVPSANTDFEPPRIVRVLYGMGFPAADYDRTTGEWSDGYMTARRDLVRASGVPVQAHLFATNDATELSGVIYSWLDPWNRARDDGRDLIYVANAGATHRLPVGWLTRACHYEPKIQGRHGDLVSHDV
ncbi:MAG: hypothetical protein HND58_12930 [Planctomycetota bacterium]|nr:MAG: hypothetical protein HND58_12930 [Planctomycetota bacterium]